MSVQPRRPTAEASDIPTPPFEIVRPQTQTVPVVIASPHSGRRYPQAFVAASRLDPLALRQSEDSFVEELFGAAPALGAPLIHALFPRAYVDANREPWELDPAMFADPLPSFANTKSPRVAAGLGTVAKVVASGSDIYRDKLTFADAHQRIEQCYRPYHTALTQLVEATRAKFGYCILIDGHSMPSIGGPGERDSGAPRVDFVLGDSFGAACATELTHAAERCLRSFGYVVTRNDPYAGGFTTRHYGQPGTGVHALQVEINRSLYMDEARFERGPGFAATVGHLARLVAALGRLSLIETRAAQ